MKSWKTMLSGILGLIGGVLQAVPGPDWLRGLGAALAGCGLLSLGAFARDNDKTSEDVGAAPRVGPTA